MVRAMRSILLDVADDDDDNVKDNNVDDFVPLGMGSNEDDERQLMLFLLLLELLLSASPDLNVLECFSQKGTEDTATDASCPSLPLLELLGPTRSST